MGEVNIFLSLSLMNWFGLVDDCHDIVDTFYCQDIVDSHHVMNMVITVGS
jgi:hypothetical protein